MKNKDGVNCEMQIERNSVGNEPEDKREVLWDAGQVEKSRMKTLAELKENCTKDNLWNCIVAFQSFTFYTISGLPFSYTLKVGRNGEYTKELFVDRMANSKSLSWSSILLAFQKALEKQDECIIRPKALGDIRGVSYVYSMLWHFGVIIVPDKNADKMRSGGR